MRNFGYDMNTAKNYVACWGGDDKTAAYAFDTVAKVAQRIIRGMSENMATVNEGFGQSAPITGYDIAKLVGMEDVYMRGKQGEVNNASNKFGQMLERLNRVKF